MRILRHLALWAVAAVLMCPAGAGAQTIIAAPGSASSLPTPVTPTNGGTGVANTGNLTWPSGGGTAALLGANNVFSAPGALSSSALAVTGAPLTSGGSGSTTFPLVYLNSGAAPSTWSVNGTILGINGPSGCTGNALDIHLNGGSSLVSIGCTGNLVLSTGTVTAPGYFVSGGGSYQFSGRGILTSPAANTIQIGPADAASPSAQKVSFQSVSSGASNTSGQNGSIVGSLSTGIGTSGDVCVQTGGTGAGATTPNTAVTGLCVKGATQLVTLPAITSDATHTDSTVCQDTTTHGLYAGSGTLGVCLGTSSARYKRDIKPLPVGLAALMAIKPVQYFYRPGHGDNGARLQYGVTAENMANAIPALASNDAEGRPNTADLVGLIPVLVNAVHQQQAEIEGLRTEVRRLGKAR